MRPGHIRDSNKTTLISLLKSRGFEAKDAGVAKDDIQQLTTVLKSALETSDLLVTTGGVSMGDRDLLRQVGQTLCVMRILPLDIRCLSTSLELRSTLPESR